MTSIIGIFSVWPGPGVRMRVSSKTLYDGGDCGFPHDPETSPKHDPLFWSPRFQPQAVKLVPTVPDEVTRQPVVVLAHLDGLELRRAADGWHGIWQMDGVEHQFWLPESLPNTAAFYVVTLPMDEFLELRAHAARRLWRALRGRKPGPDFRNIPDQLRAWHIMSLRALDARLQGESYRSIAEGVLGFHGTKEDFESDPRKNRVRRLAAHGIRMMRGGYRLMLHYPIKVRQR
ncbi:DUF2285 domain-containing protein [Martelella soudanensis]